MALYKNVEFDDHLVGVVRHMNTVEEYRETLHGLQAVWDNLTLLGQMSGAGTDMSDTRQAFSRLTGDLLNRLGEETLQKTVVEMSAKAQVAIDILVRNLFERTADIGFLAIDDDIRAFLRRCRSADADARRDAAQTYIRERFSEYVAKYSVYRDIVLLDPAGNVLARLDDAVEVARSRHPLVKEALATSEAYVETYDVIDLFPDTGKSLVYAYRVTDDDGAPIGVLCLAFRFANEMARIFANLAAPDDWAVILLLDESGTVIASSDEFHIPCSARLEKVIGSEYRIDRFAGREYLAATRATHGYQGYVGPGWFGHVMLPVQHAFDKDASEMLRGIDPAVLRTVMASTSLFGEELRSIPVQANRIQRELNRSVWNGNVRQSTDRKALNSAFSKILLWEISNTGSRTKDVFARSIANLHETVVSAILQDSSFFASLAIDIMDRNLYERANDCRWWALTSAFRELLATERLTNDDAERLSSILRTINGLYTVYANLIVFDRRGQVVAVSKPDEASWIGKTINEDWVHHTLTLADSQSYAVSNFATTPLYAGHHTYLYGAAIRAPGNGQIVGGVGIVFDSTPQFAAMLQDALPRDDSSAVVKGTFGLFVDRSGRVIASTSPDYRPGASVRVSPGFLTLAPGEARAGIELLGQTFYAVGARMSSGYREYKGEQDAYRNDIAALVFVPLCSNQEIRQRVEPRRPVVRSDRNEKTETVEVATFLIGNKWFGLRAEQIAESMAYKGTTPVPGAGSDFAGYLMYKDNPIPVFDIGRIVDATPPEEAAERQVIVLRKCANGHFGILVDDLGEIPEVSASRLQILPEFIAGGNVLADTIVMTDKPDAETLLIVLSVSRIATRLVSLAGDMAESLSVIEALVEA